MNTFIWTFFVLLALVALALWAKESGKGLGATKNVLSSKRFWVTIAIICVTVVGYRMISKFEWGKHQEASEVILDMEDLTPLSSYREYNLPAGACTPWITTSKGSRFLGWKNPESGALQPGCGFLFFNGQPNGYQVCEVDGEKRPAVNVDHILGGPGKLRSLKICSEAPRLDVVVFAEF
jgi:hypothetical protein